MLGDEGMGTKAYKHTTNSRCVSAADTAKILLPPICGNPNIAHVRKILHKKLASLCSLKIRHNGDVMPQWQHINSPPAGTAHACAPTQKRHGLGMHSSTSGEILENDDILQDDPRPECTDPADDAGGVKDPRPGSMRGLVGTTLVASSEIPLIGRPGMTSLRS